ncbi:MAG TPA: hypothetical protein VLD19_10165 [Chitinophagaceae bacterium]|nr:hypothetical protein [Chitinophagaceae bacterium]
MTGAAFLLLKKGKTEEEALELLWVRQKDLVERGCAIAATIYEGLAAHFKREWMLWAYAEEAMAMLEEGKPDEAVLAVMWKLYASEFEEGYREEGVFLHELPEVEEKAIKHAKDIERRSRMVVLADGKMVVMQAKPARKEGRRCNLRPEKYNLCLEKYNPCPEKSNPRLENSDVSPPLPPCLISS